jgi:hypothetical protein
MIKLILFFNFLFLIDSVYYQPFDDYSYGNFLEPRLCICPNLERNKYSGIIVDGW